MKKILLLSTLFFATALVAQTDFNQMILGTWELQERIDNNPVENNEIFGTDSDSDKEDDPEPNEIFLFQDNRTVDVQEFGEQHKYSYQLIDSALHIGRVFYKVKRLTKDSLTLNRKEKWTNTDEDLILTRSSKTIEPIPKELKIRTEYPSGQIKLSGLKISGFRHGIWTEWYENGRVKSVTHYQKDDVLMTVEFNKEGNITSKSFQELVQFASYIE